MTRDTSPAVESDKGYGCSPFFFVVLLLISLLARGLVAFTPFVFSGVRRPEGVFYSSILFFEMKTPTTIIYYHTTLFNASSEMKHQPQSLNAVVVASSPTIKGRNKECGGTRDDTRGQHRVPYFRLA